MGPTFYMTLCCFAIIIVLALIAICIGRHMNLQEKNKERLHKLED